MEVLGHQYVNKRILELFVGNSRFLNENLLNQLFYNMDIKESCWNLKV